MNMRFTVFCALAPVLAACGEPSSFEEFVRADKAENGVYEFVLDLTDSLSSYDISLFTKVDAPVMGTVHASSSMGLEIAWREAGTSIPALSETVYLPYGEKGGGASLYRSGVKPSSPGSWTVSVRPVEPPSGLRGIGIICKRNGTR